MLFYTCASNYIHIAQTKAVVQQNDNELLGSHALCYIYVDLGGYRSTAPSYWIRLKLRQHIRAHFNKFARPISRSSLFGEQSKWSCSGFVSVSVCLSVRLSVCLSVFTRFLASSPNEPGFEVYSLAELLLLLSSSLLYVETMEASTSTPTTLQYHAKQHVMPWLEINQRWLIDHRVTHSPALPRPTRIAYQGIVGAKPSPKFLTVFCVLTVITLLVLS